MYVRLAFAVAAHLEPEILIVDEVLAVGDVQFQKKCLGKMEDVGKEGRTVLFVSHQMSAIESLCSRGILLESGKTSVDSTPPEAIRIYLENAYNLVDRISLGKRVDRSGTGRIRATKFRIIDEEGYEAPSLLSGKDYYFQIEYSNNIGQVLNDVVISLDVFDEKNNNLLLFRTSFTNSNVSLDAKQGSVFCKVENFPLANGCYRFSIFLSHADSEILDYIQDAASITVDGGDFFGTGSPGLPSHCKILTKAQWSTTVGSELFEKQVLLEDKSN